MRYAVKLMLTALAAAGAGCAKTVSFPVEPLRVTGGEPQLVRSYDTDGDGAADYFTFAAATGRIETVGYDRDGDAAPDRMVDLDAISPDRSRHLVIILDGVGHDLVASHFQAGGLRLFYPPSLVIAPYPTMTDVCMEDILGYVHCRAFEARYYDHNRGRVVGGSLAYLAGENQPYNRLLGYRAGSIWHAIGYVAPRPVFAKEINDAKRQFDKARTQEMIAYFVSSAGMGTAAGADGHKHCLVQVERLVNQIVAETQGLTKVTLLSDHGHSYTPARRAPIRRFLKEKGWRLTERLRGRRDVAYIRFGLETCASFATLQAAALASDLIGCEGVELVSYVDGQEVVLLGRDGGRAAIRHNGGRFGYRTIAADPLKLTGILGDLKADEAGLYDADELLAATGRHEYPAPLQRLWRAHLGLVADPPDVIASLGDEYYSGSDSFAARVRVASTHGGLNYKNSAAFIMSTAGPLPELLRSADIPAAMSRLLDRPWPMRR